MSIYCAVAKLPPDDCIYIRYDMIAFAVCVPLLVSVCRCVPRDSFAPPPIPVRGSLYPPIPPTPHARHPSVIRSSVRCHAPRVHSR